MCKGDYSCLLYTSGRLTPEEFEVMKTHSAIGAQIMEDALQRHHEDLIQVAYNICRWHHERYDGQGYPDGLRGVHLDKDTTPFPR